MIKRKSKIYISIIFLILSVSNLSIPCSSSFMFNIDELDQFQTVREGDAGIGSSEYRIAQSFKPTLNTLTRVELLAEKMGDPSGYLQISIKNELNGDDLTFSVMPTINISTNGNWYEFDFPDINVPSEHPLYIVWAPASYLWDDENQIVWGCNWQDNPYIRGEMWNEYPYGNWYIGNASWDCCFKTYGYNRENEPPNVPNIIGSKKGNIDKEIPFNISCEDPDGDDVFFYIDWGDGETEEWIGPFTSGRQIKFSHSWNKKGDFHIKVKSKDIFYEESDYATFSISMPKSKYRLDSFQLILQRFLNSFPFLSEILKTIK